MFCWLVLENPDAQRLALSALRRALRGQLLPGVRPGLVLSAPMPATQLARAADGLPWMQLMSLRSDDRRGRLLREPLDHWEAELASPQLSRVFGGHVSLGLSDHPPVAWAAAWKMGRLARSLHSKDQKRVSREEILRTGLGWALGESVRLEPEEAVSLPERLQALLDEAPAVELRTRGTGPARA